VKDGKGVGNLYHHDEKGKERQRLMLKNKGEPQNDFLLGLLSELAA